MQRHMLRVCFLIMSWPTFCVCVCVTGTTIVGGVIKLNNIDAVERSNVRGLWVCLRQNDKTVAVTKHALVCKSHVCLIPVGVNESGCFVFPPVDEGDYTILTLVVLGRIRQVITRRYHVQHANGE